MSSLHVLRESWMNLSECKINTGWTGTSLKWHRGAIHNNTPGNIRMSSSHSQWIFHVRFDKYILFIEYKYESHYIVSNYIQYVYVPKKTGFFSGLAHESQMTNVVVVSLNVAIATLFATNDTVICIYIFVYVPTLSVLRCAYCHILAGIIPMRKRKSVISDCIIKLLWIVSVVAVVVAVAFLRCYVDSNGTMEWILENGCERKGTGWSPTTESS